MPGALSFINVFIKSAPDIAPDLSSDVFTAFIAFKAGFSIAFEVAFTTLSTTVVFKSPPAAPNPMDSKVATPAFFQSSRVVGVSFVKLFVVVCNAVQVPSVAPPAAIDVAILAVFAPAALPMLVLNPLAAPLNAEVPAIALVPTSIATISPAPSIFDTKSICPVISSTIFVPKASIYAFCQSSPFSALSKKALTLFSSYSLPVNSLKYFLNVAGFPAFPAR